MFRKTLFSLALSALLGLGWAASPAMAAAVGTAPGLFQGMAGNVANASFWAQPYPYGYRWRPNRCVRYVPVETFWGVRWVPVWVCR